MIAVDTNILIYAHRTDFVQHESALAAIRGLATGGDPWGIPVFVIGEFLRVTTHPRIFRRPSSRSEATGALDGLLRSSSVRLLLPGARYWDLLKETVAESSARGDLIPDAEIVAVCREHGVDTIFTEDRGILRFPSIRVRTLSR